jgi:hypothetical protein
MAMPARFDERIVGLSHSPPTGVVRPAAGLQPNRRVTARSGTNRGCRQHIARLVHEHNRDAAILGNTIETFLMPVL